MKVALLSALVLFSSLLYVNSAPLFGDDDDFDLDFNFPTVDCSQFSCPSGSTSCSKRTTTSQDKQLVTHEIKCYDSNGQETKSDVTSTQNPVPDSIQSGYEFYGSYSGGTHITSNGGNVETFNKK